MNELYASDFHIFTMSCSICLILLLLKQSVKCNTFLGRSPTCTHVKQVWNICQQMAMLFIGLQDANNFLDIPFKENISICDFLIKRH